VSRAILFGLFLGLAAAAVFLSWQSWANAHIECAAPGSEECTFDEQTHNELARLQSYSAVGLACLASGMFLLSRRRP
jgi:hypothetical protein